jgi:hypothetical protein
VAVQVADACGCRDVNGAMQLTTRGCLRVAAGYAKVVPMIVWTRGRLRLDTLCMERQIICYSVGCREGFRLKLYRELWSNSSVLPI